MIVRRPDEDEKGPDDTMGGATVPPTKKLTNAAMKAVEKIFD